MWDKLQAWIKKYDRTLAILAGSFCLTLLLLHLDFNWIEAGLYDLRMSKGSQPPTDPSIILITLDNATSKELDEFPPLSLDYHTRLLERLEELQPKAVGYLMNMNQVHEVNPELFRKDSSTRFVNTANRMISHGIPFLFGTPFDVTGETVPPYPLSALPHFIAIIHKDGNVFAEDKITRRALLSLDDKLSFHLALAQKLGFVQSGQLPKGSFSVPEVDGRYFFFRYHGTTALLPKRHTWNLPYTRYSFVDILKNRVPANKITGKIILVGPMSFDDSGDFALTPFSKMAFTNPKLVIHANILDSIIHNDGIVRAPPLLNWLITFVVVMTVFWWIVHSTPLYGVFATLILGIIFLITGQILFQMEGLWLRESQPLVGIFISYYLAVPYRLIREYKQRWEYQRKNEILTQVEELKTNFLSLVTHDLKTPVARIQGLAELLLRKTTNQITPNHQETLRHILTATDELNHFISSILELNRVESNRIQLQLESKDINLLIERAIERFEPEAQTRQIQIHSELEPLFPVKIDVSLMSKVLNNLIDNALKYSSPHSRIQIASLEENDHIVIRVEDQGIGMTIEEQQNLFTRFYRAKNDTTTRISGTGLGLYLTKYFIEAHHGRVEVQSEKNKGSTFKIFLPLLEGDQRCSEYS